MTTLNDAISTGDWDEVNHRLDDSFFRYLITDPGSLRAAFEALPDVWYERFPRHIMSRAIANALGTQGMMLDESVLEAFRNWVLAQESPALRDVLGLHQARLRVLLNHAWYGDASTEADTLLQLVQTAPDHTGGLHDVMPSVLLRCGTAKLLAADVDAASTCFTEAIRWSDSRQHPLGRFAREHLGLVHALNERYEQAKSLLHGEAIRSQPETLQYHLEVPGVIARLLVAVGMLQLDAADRLLHQVDVSMRQGEFGWIVLHAEASLAIARESPWELVHRVSHHLETDVVRAGPATVAGSILRADLVGLYQVGDDLRAADRILRTPELSREQPHVLVARARQALIMGRHEQAMSILQADESSHAFTVATRFRSSGAVLYASAELELSGQVDSTAVSVAASSVTYNGAFWSLLGASKQLRDHLTNTIGLDGVPIPAPWGYRARTKLTHREQDVLRALRTHRTINDVAASLHVSPNTAKTHVRALYRKLEVHTRDEALWIGREEERRR